MSTPEIGEIYIVAGKRYEVIGVNDPDDGCGVQVWMRNVKSGTARTYSEETVKSWERVKPFFEEKKNYRFGEGQVVSIWHVLDLARGPVAVGQTTDSTPCMMTDFHGWHEVR